MPARFIGNAGSPAMISKQENPCTRFFALKELRPQLLRNRRNAFAVKLVAGDLPTGNRQKSRQPHRKHLQHLASQSKTHKHQPLIFQPDVAMLHIDRESSKKMQCGNRTG